ncbi:MAG TPA: TerD family protein [Blastocatellia bacterium]|nr:TerD family protein [Blastocatellia bacterium]
MNRNLEGLGYTLSRRALEAVATLEPEAAARLHAELLAVLGELRGVRNYRPMYPNFPRQVMGASSAELYLNALVHYLTVWVSDAVGDEDRAFVWRPAYRKEARPDLADDVTLHVVDLGTLDDLRQIFTRMISSKTSISESDKADLRWFITSHAIDLHGEIPNKEILAVVGALSLDAPDLARHVRTATDVLRIAAALSDGDVSLAAPTRYRALKRSERKALLALLDGCGGSTEDMLRWKDHWIRLGERLHPGEFAQRYPQAARSFEIVRNSLPYPTFRSQVENALRGGDVNGAIDLLRNRPGEFARRLDHLLRLRPSFGVVGSFGEVASDISTTVLLQLIAHFKHRNAPHDRRIFFPKGNLAKVMAIDNRLPELPWRLCDQVIQDGERVLRDRFSRRPALGRVFVDERLRDYLVPFSQRSASRSLRTIARGSRIALPNGGDTIRLFLWWKEGVVRGIHTGRVDVDLSAVMLDADWNYKEHVAYTNLRSARYRAYHSGDITSAPNGACEFIDIDLPSVFAYGGRYIIMSVNSYTRQRFSTLPECKAGWMMREHPDSGEIFDPRTVEDALDVASETTIAVPLIVDVVARKTIFADIGLTRNPRFVNNIHGNSAQMTLLGRAMTEIAKPDLYSLFVLHGDARGVLVESESSADLVFGIERGVAPYDLDTITSEYL